jgi:hypothetical protein
MNGKHRLILEEVFSALSEVGERLSAIDHQHGEENLHWQTISALGHSIRRQAGELPDEIFVELPALAVYALTVNSIDSCWGQCLDELDSYLSQNGHAHD